MTVQLITHAAIQLSFLNDPVEFARLLGILVPLAVAALAKSTAPKGLKAVLNVALAALAGVIGTLVGADGEWDWGAFFDAWLNAFVVGIAAYYGVLKPTGIAPSLARNVPGIVGPSRPAPPPA